MKKRSSFDVSFIYIVFKIHDFMTSVELFSNDDVLALEVIMKHLRNVCYVVSED